VQADAADRLEMQYQQDIIAFHEADSATI